MTSNWTIVGLVIAAILLAIGALCAIVVLYIMWCDLRDVHRQLRSRDDDRE